VHRRTDHAQQPLLGVAGLSLVLPVALLLALGAGGAEPSLRVLAPLVTFGLPVVAIVAFWWEDWPGTALGPSWSGWADTVLIVVAAVLLTVLGQLVVGHADVGGLFDPFAGPEHAPTFPATLPLAGATFVAMLQITLVSERWPLERLPRRTGGPARWCSRGSSRCCSTSWCWAAGRPPAPARIPPRR
jgi:hypothetical protein